MLFLHNTSRVDDEPYPTLLRDKGFTGFPTLCFMDAEGNVLTKKVSRTVDGFASVRDQLKQWSDLKAQVAKGGGAEQQKKLFLVELDLGMLEADAIKDHAKKLTLSKEEQTLVDQHLFDAELAALSAKQRELGREKYAEEFLALAKTGRTPTKDRAIFYYNQVVAMAVQAKDVELAEKAYATLEKVPDVPERLLQSLRKRIDDAKN